MFVAIVQIPMTRRSRDDAVASATRTAPSYSALKPRGLIRKYYLNGDSGGGGVYLWESEEAARAWFTPGWSVRVQSTFGAAPTVTYYDNHVVVDNEADAVRVERQL